MSLINLLTVGATFKGVRNQSGSYKLASIAPLPRFGVATPAATAVVARKEPITTSAAAPAQVSLFEPAPILAPQESRGANPVRLWEVEDKQSQAGRSPKIPGVGSEGTIDLPADSPKRTTPLATQKAQPQAAKPAPVRAARRLNSPIQGIKRLAHQFVFGRPPRSPETPNVQAELALEKVTVVRNDLSDEGSQCESKIRKDPATTCVTAAETVGGWFHLAASFGKRLTPANEKLPAQFAEAPRSELVGRM